MGGREEETEKRAQDKEREREKRSHLNRYPHFRDDKQHSRKDAGFGIQ